MASLITVDYEDLPGSPKEYISKGKIEVLRELICDYSDRVTLAKQMLGYTVAGVLYTPDEYDAGDEVLYNVWAQDATIEPILGLDGAGSYSKAKVTIRYGTPTYDTPSSGTTYATESLEPAAQFIMLDKEGLYWDDDVEVKSNEAPSKVIRLVDWVYTIHNVETIPAWVYTHIGKVNDANVYSETLDKTFSTETLLCGNPDLQREVDQDGNFTWTITVRMTYNPNTSWNHFPRVSGGDGTVTYERIYKATGGGSGDIVYPYDEADFGDILVT